jgi:hypothetical protein
VRGVFGLLACHGDKPEPMDPVDMTSTSKHPENATLETEFLRRLFARDDRVWRERMAARDRIVSSRPVRRHNPQIEKARPASLSPFEEPVSFGRLS